MNSNFKRPVTHTFTGHLHIAYWNVDRRVEVGKWECVRIFGSRDAAQRAAKTMEQGGAKFRVRPQIPPLPVGTVGAVRWENGSFEAQRYCKATARMRKIVRCQDINEAYAALSCAETAWAAEDARNGY